MRANYKIEFFHRLYDVESPILLKIDKLPHFYPAKLHKLDIYFLLNLICCIKYFIQKLHNKDIAWFIKGFSIQNKKIKKYMKKGWLILQTNVILYKSQGTNNKTFQVMDLNIEKQIL